MEEKRINIINWINSKNATQTQICNEYNKMVVDSIEVFRRAKTPLTLENFRRYTKGKEWLRNISYNEFAKIVETANDFIKHVSGNSEDLRKQLLPITNSSLTRRMGKDMMEYDCKEITFENYAFLDCMSKNNPKVQLPEIVKSNLEMYREAEESRRYTSKYVMAINRMMAAFYAARSWGIIRTPSRNWEAEQDVNKYLRRLPIGAVYRDIVNEMGGQPYKLRR